MKDEWDLFIDYYYGEKRPYMQAVNVLQRNAWRRIREKKGY